MKRVVGLLAISTLLVTLACGSLPSFLVEPTATPIPRETGVVGSDVDLPPATVVNEEGGPVQISGNVTYTNEFFTAGVAQPLVILEDQAGFVERDRDYIIPVGSQTLGHITSDFYTSPFTYSVTLPAVPQGTAKDVDNDDVEETGVMVFAIAYWNNRWGDPYLQERDLGGGGWSTAYASTRVSDDLETEREIIGGNLVIYAPEAGQGFPAGFGADGLLFTEDDPVVEVPQGWTTVNLDEEPFLFDRARAQSIDLIEPEGAALKDFSDLDYVEAFDALVDFLSKHYAFTEYKGINWDALHEEYRPRFEQAQRFPASTEDYRRALRDFMFEIPDGHVSGPFVASDFRDAAGGGIGMAVREVDDGSAYVTFLSAGGAADSAGIEYGAEILSINGTPISDAIGREFPWLGPHSTEHVRRIDQSRWVTRFPLGETVTVTYRNPDDRTDQTANLTAEQDPDSLNAVIPQAGSSSSFNLPVEYEILDSGFAYVQIFSFFDSDVLTVLLWERLMMALNEEGVPGVIIDMRDNTGGWGFLADQMAAYFFDEDLVLGNSGVYEESLGEFYFDPETARDFILPREELRYDGDVVVITGAQCFSACEFYTFDMTLQGRAEVIGYYPTGGLGGGVREIAMPEDVTLRYTASRAVGPDGNIHIEGKGVAPTIDVPFTQEALFAEEDLLLQVAVDYLAGR